MLTPPAAGDHLRPVANNVLRPANPQTHNNVNHMNILNIFNNLNNSPDLDNMLTNLTPMMPERRRLSGNFDLTTLAKLQVPFLVEDDEPSHSLSLLIRLAVNFLRWISHPTNNHEHVSDVVFLDASTLLKLHHLPHLLEELVVMIFIGHVVWQETHRCQDRPCKVERYVLRLIPIFFLFLHILNHLIELFEKLLLEKVRAFAVLILFLLVLQSLLFFFSELLCTHSLLYFDLVTQLVKRFVDVGASPIRHSTLWVIALGAHRLADYVAIFVELFIVEHLQMINVENRLPLRAASLV